MVRLANKMEPPAAENDFSKRVRRQSSFGIRKPKRYWLGLAITTLIGFAFANFVSGRSVAGVSNGHIPLGQVGMMSVAFGCGSVFIAFLSLNNLIPAKYSKGFQEIPLPNRQVLWESLTLPQLRRRMGMAILAGFVNYSGLLCLTMAFAVDPDGAPISSAIASGASIIVSLGCYLIFNEHLSKWEVLGILIAVGGVILMAIVHAKKTTYVSPLLGFLAMIFWGLFKNLLDAIWRLGFVVFIYSPAIPSWV